MVPQLRPGLRPRHPPKPAVVKPPESAPEVAPTQPATAKPAKAAPAPADLAPAKEAADHINQMMGEFAGGGTPKAAVDAGLAKLDGLDQGQLYHAAKLMDVDAGLTPNSPRAKIAGQIHDMVRRVWKTSDNVNHGEPAGGPAPRMAPVVAPAPPPVPVAASVASSLPNVDGMTHAQASQLKPGQRVAFGGTEREVVSSKPNNRSTTIFHPTDATSLDQVEVPYQTHSVVLGDSWGGKTHPISFSNQDERVAAARADWNDRIAASAPAVPAPKAAPAPRVPAAPPGLAPAKAAADHLNGLMTRFAGGGSKKAEVDAGLAKLDGLSREQLLHAAKLMDVDAGLTASSPRAKIAQQIGDTVRRAWKTSDNVNHGEHDFEPAGDSPKIPATPVDTAIPVAYTPGVGSQSAAPKPGGRR